MARYNKELNKTSLKTNKDLEVESLAKSAIVVLMRYSNQVEVGGCINKIKEIHGISSLLQSS